MFFGRSKLFVNTLLTSLFFYYLHKWKETSSGLQFFPQYYVVGIPYASSIAGNLRCFEKVVESNQIMQPA